MLLILCGGILIALDDGLKKANFSKDYAGIYFYFLNLIFIAGHEGMMIVLAVLVFALIDMISQWWKLDYNY